MGFRESFLSQFLPPAVCVLMTFRGIAAKP